MNALMGSLVCIAVVYLGISLIVGAITPEEAMKRLGALIGIVIFLPAIVGIVLASLTGLFGTLDRLLRSAVTDFVVVLVIVLAALLCLGAGTRLAKRKGSGSEIR